MKSQVLQFVSTRCSVGADALRLALRPLSGGLESAVARATLRGARSLKMPVPRRFVIKELRGIQRREAAVYQELCHGADDPPIARMLGADCSGEAHYLFLEDVRPHSPWPWAGTDLAAEVCRVLAKLHSTPRLTSNIFIDWDYEAELARSAHDTLAVALMARDSAGTRFWRRIGDLKRVVAALPRLRARILEDEAALIHGDIHPGNVIVTRKRGANRIVLIDWARARIGSPWEDVASWLHSLGCWEPEPRRRHDTLLRQYVKARHGSALVTAELRSKYWFASASNGLSGAIRYHLAVLGDSASTDHMRAHSQRALPAWERVIRRAAALLPPLTLAEAEHRPR